MCCFQFTNSRQSSRFIKHIRCTQSFSRFNTCSRYLFCIMDILPITSIRCRPYVTQVVYAASSHVSRQTTIRRILFHHCAGFRHVENHALNISMYTSGSPRLIRPHCTETTAPYNEQCTDYLLFTESIILTSTRCASVND